jgi:hypothetical protein
MKPIETILIEDLYDAITSRMKSIKEWTSIWDVDAALLIAIRRADGTIESVSRNKADGGKDENGEGDGTKIVESGLKKLAVDEGTESVSSSNFQQFLFHLLLHRSRLFHHQLYFVRHFQWFHPLVEWQ